MVLTTTNRFPGHLGLAPLEQRLRVWTRFDSDAVEVGTADGESFEWPLDVVAARSYDTRTMELDLDGARLYFVADDPLRFADEFREIVGTRPQATVGAERPQRASTIEGDPLDFLKTIPVLQPPTTPSLRRSVDRERLVPLGPRGKMVKPKKHAHLWQATDASYGITRYVCEVCRHVTIHSPGSAITVDLRTRTIAGRRITG